MANQTFIGVGFLTALDIISDVSLKLFQPLVQITFNAPVAVGFGTVLTVDPSVFVGAQLVAGVLGTNAEVVTVLASVPGVSFTAKFVNAHSAGEPINGATFPVQNSAGDPYFTTSEMLTYLSNATNDFLTRVSLVYNVSEGVVFGPSSPVQPLPSDCLTPVRVAAFGIGLRETSQSNLDSVNFMWQEAALGEPYVYYRDKIGTQNLGVWPRAANTTAMEIVYRQRGAQLMGLGDGFLVPDCFLPIIKHRTMSIAYSKDGEARSPSMAKYWGDRYETGVRIANIVLGFAEDQSGQ